MGDQVYFNESAECANTLVDEVLSKWKSLLERLGEEEKGKVLRSMGLKIEQLKVMHKVPKRHMKNLGGIAVWFTLCCSRADVFLVSRYNRKYFW